MVMEVRNRTFIPSQCSSETRRQAWERATIIAAEARPSRSDNLSGQILPNSAYVVITGLKSNRSARRAGHHFQQSTGSKPKDPHRYLFATTSEAQDRMTERPSEFKAKGIGMVIFDTLEDAAACEGFSLLLLLERSPSSKENPKDGRPYFTALAVVPMGPEDERPERHHRHRRVDLTTTWDRTLLVYEDVTERTVVLL